MIKKINLGNKKLALKFLSEIKNRGQTHFDIKINNSHILNLNKLIGRNVFKKDTLYIGSETLWEIMQPIGGKGKHNYHGLTEEDVFIALSSIKNPYAVLVSRDNRYSIISIKLSHFSERLKIIVEVGSELKDRINANVNKIVTIYPKDNVDDYIDRLENDSIIFRKKNR